MILSTSLISIFVTTCLSANLADSGPAPPLAPAVSIALAAETGPALRQDEASDPTQPIADQDQTKKIISDHIRARLNRSRSQWGLTGIQALGRIPEFVKDFDATSYASRINDLVAGQIPPGTSFDELRALTVKLKDPAVILTNEDETNYEKSMIEAIESIVAEAQKDAASKLQTGADADRPQPGAPGGEGAGETGDPSKVLADNKAFDLFDESHRNDLAKLTAALAVKYYPEGKPRTQGGFDKMTPAQQTDVISKNASDYVREIVRSELKKAGASDQTIAEVLSPIGFESPAYQKNFETLAEAIVSSRGNPAVELQPIDGISESLRKELQEHLEARNEEHNNNANDTIAHESKLVRAGRLLEDAKRFLEVNDALGGELKGPKLASVMQYCERYARPETLGEEEPRATSDNIEDYKASIYGKIRELYKEMGGFGRVLGIFGLKGYFAGIIADALARRLDRVLTGDERDKINQWAAALATELHGTEPDTAQVPGQVRQPGGVIQYPVQNPYGYTRMPLVPVMPYGKWGHGAKWGGYRSGGYVVPAQGGYMIVPR